MKKFLTGIVVLSLASVAFAVPAFVINGGNDVVIAPGTSVTVPIVVSGITGATGMTLNLMTTGAYDIEGIDIDTVAGGLFAGAAGTGASVFTHVIDPENVPAWAGVAMVTAASTVNASVNTVVAMVTISAQAAGPAGGTLQTALPEELGGGSSFLDGTGAYVGAVQGSVNLLPEPVSALLLLAGLPLIRRRRA